MNPCACTPECGCKDADTIKPPPACDNSAVPSAFSTKCGSRWGSDNTMCKYTGMGSKCSGGVCARGLTQDEKDLVLKKHNDLRRKVAKGQQAGQPSASNMNELVWDNELEMVAQRWTDQCTGGHDKNRKTPNYASVGQNYASKSNSANLADNEVDTFVQMWFDEVSY